MFWLLSIKKIENQKFKNSVLLFIKQKSKNRVLLFALLKIINRSRRFDLSSFERNLKFVSSTSTWMYQVFMWYCSLVNRNVAYEFLSMCRICFKSRKQGLMKNEMLLVADKAWSITTKRVYLSQKNQIQVVIWRW